MFQEIVTTVLAFCTVATACVVVANFRRNSTFDNENTVFKTKMDSYFILTQKIIELIDKIKATLSINDVAEIFAEVELLDQKANAVFNIALRYSTILPNKVLDQLDILHKFVKPHNKNLDEVEKTENFLVMNIDYYNEILKHLDTVHAEMRKDLGSEKLNKSLLKRIH